MLVVVSPNKFLLVGLQCYCYSPLKSWHGNRGLSEMRATICIWTFWWLKRTRTVCVHYYGRPA